MRIVKDYNQYVLRNLDRGYSRKELGVSYVKACSYIVFGFDLMMLHGSLFLCKLHYAFLLNKGTYLLLVAFNVK
jgi:hypothetical protein